MTEFFVMFASFWQRILNLLDDYSFTVANVNVSLLTILLSALVFSVIISVFWRGARA